MLQASGPTPSTVERLKKANELISEGQGKIKAMRQAGIDPATYYKWNGKVAAQGVQREPQKTIKPERERRAKQAKYQPVQALEVLPPAPSRMAVVFATPDQVLNILRGL